MNRRDVIAFLGSAAAWPLAARAQQLQRMRRIGVLMDLPEDNRSRPRVAAFMQGLKDLGWMEGRDVQVDIRWGASAPEISRPLAGELLTSQPEVVVASGSSATAAVRQTSASVPLIFVLVTDPVAAGFVDSLARPGGHTTGFTLFEYAIAGKWLELLKEVAPGTKRAAVLRDLGVAAGAGQFGAIQAVAPSFGVELRPVGMADAGQIEQGLSTFAPGPNDGMIVTASPLAALHRAQIISLAGRYRLPSVFAYRHFVAAGGLVAYGPDLIDPFRRAASYASRILRGDQPVDLPVQAPTRYELTMNVRTARTLGIEIPPTLIARADEVIE